MPARTTFLSLPAELRQQILLNLLSEDDLRRIWHIIQWRVGAPDGFALLKDVLTLECPAPEVSADMAYCVGKWVKWVKEHAIAKTNPERRRRLIQGLTKDIDRSHGRYPPLREVQGTNPIIEMTPTIAFENHCTWLRRLYEHDQMMEKWQRPQSYIHETSRRVPSIFASLRD